MARTQNSPPKKENTMSTKDTKKDQNVHIVLQEKGGIGKSFVANMLLQYLTAQGKPVAGLDTDPSNATLACYESLNVQQLDIMEGNRINIKLFDELIMLIHSTDEDYVIDIGSSNFIGFNEYAVSQNIYSLIESLGPKVYLHIIVVGGEAKGQTLVGLNKIVSNDVPNDSVIIWENEHFGKIDENMRVLESVGIKEISEKIHGGVILEQVNNDLEGDDLRAMQKKHYTFEDIKESDSFNFVEKLRLNEFRKKLWEKLDNLFPVAVVEPANVAE